MVFYEIRSCSYLSMAFFQFIGSASSKKVKSTQLAYVELAIVPNVQYTFSENESNYFNEVTEVFTMFRVYLFSYSKMYGQYEFTKYFEFNFLRQIYKYISINDCNLLVIDRSKPFEIGLSTYADIYIRDFYKGLIKAIINQSRFNLEE